MKDLVIFGAGGFGREAVLMINGINYTSPNTYRLLGFVVDREYFKPGMTVNGLPVLGDPQWLFERKDQVCCVIAVGDVKPRERVFHMLDEQGVQIETIIAPNVYVDPTCKIGRGCYIGDRTMLSVNSEIGDGVFINTDCVFGHDLKIGDFATIWTRATISGGCVIGRGAEIGGGTYMIPRKKVGDGAVVAAGSVVFANVKAGTHVLGNPAKRIEL